MFAGKIFELPLCSTRCCTKTMDLDVRSNLVCMAGIALDLQGQRCGRVPLTWSLICIPLHTASVSKGRTSGSCAIRHNGRGGKELAEASVQSLHDQSYCNSCGIASMNGFTLLQFCQTTARRCKLLTNPCTLLLCSRYAVRSSLALSNLCKRFAIGMN